MRILFVTPYVPSLVRIRPFAFIRELSRRGHQITLVCLVQPSNEEIYLSQVAPFCKAVHPVHLKTIRTYLNTIVSLPTRTPLSVAFCRSNEYKSLVKNLVQNTSFDLIHTEFIRATQATNELTGITKIFDSVDSLTLAYKRSLDAPMVPLKQRLISWIEWHKMKYYEIQNLDYYHRIIVSSPIDKAYLDKNNRQISVIANGVDLTYFSPREDPGKSNTIAFLGKMSYYVNVASVLWFYNLVLPLIRQKIPDIKFKIIGREPVSRILALTADPSVEVTGTVPDVRPHLSQGAVAVCPMVGGSGIQFKMLEAMAIGLPCISTSIASQPLLAKPGQDLLVADDPAAFAEAVLELLENNALRSQVGENGRRYVEQHHNWEQIGQKLDQVYQDAVQITF